MATQLPRPDGDQHVIARARTRRSATRTTTSAAAHARPPVDPLARVQQVEPLAGGAERVSTLPSTRIAAGRERVGKAGTPAPGSARSK